MGSQQVAAELELQGRSVGLAGSVKEAVVAWPTGRRASLHRVWDAELTQMQPALFPSPSDHTKSSKTMPRLPGPLTCARNVAVSSSA